MERQEGNFNDFQLEEYKNISNAHFETNKQIGIFFRYFLLIASAPTLIILLFGKSEKFLYDIIIGVDTYLNIFIGTFLMVVSFIGLISCFYIISLRLDSILYARTVNGIRGYFHRIKVDFEEHFRYLPKQTNQPKYHDTHTFGILVFSIALIDAIYFSIGSLIISRVGYDFFVIQIKIPIIIDFGFRCFVLSFAFFLFIHLGYYWWISKYRLSMYLKSRIIGIDIDGVLNKHRETFCEIHEKNLHALFEEKEIPVELKLTPEEITIIPVSQIDTKKIRVDHEYDVFNNPSYWSEQVVIDKNVGKIIKELKNSFGYNINIHSFRPWPQYTYGKILDVENINKLWGIKTLNFCSLKFTFKKAVSLKKMTKKWLKKHEIPYNSLFIEKSSIDYSKRKVSILGLLLNSYTNQFNNRFYYTNLKPYKYFIEDSVENAIKLASTCEYVFLIEQPYNSKVEKESLPYNIIQVKDWNEIKKKIKKLG